MSIEIVQHPLGRTVLIGSGKGGVGKTSVAVGLAAACAADGLSVLLVDLDPQGNVAEDLGYVGSELDDDGAQLALALMGRGELAPVSAGRQGLWVVPGGAHLREAQRWLDIDSAQHPSGAVDHTYDNGSAYASLSGPLARIAMDYDLVVIDSPPGTASLSKAAMGSARWLIVPARDDDSSRKGLRRIEIDFAAARAAGARVELLAVLLFGSPAAATAKRADALARLREDLGDDAPVLANDIRQSTAATAARYLGLTAAELAHAYAALPPWHQMRGAAAKADVVLPLPDTPAMRDTDPAEVMRVIRGTGGNLDALAADYARLTEEIFSLISAREESAERAEEVGV